MTARLLCAYGLAALAVLPLLATDVWSGFRLGLTDPVLAAIASTEQPLSVRSLSGIWAMALTIAWFGLVYRTRQVSVWEAGLVLIGSAAALARLGNAWFDAAAMLLPLARQLSGTVAVPGPRTRTGLAVLSLGVTVVIVASGRPPELAQAARDSAGAISSSGPVFTDWRWAPELQQQLGGNRTVLASHGLAAESTDFWLDYLRVIQGHQRWAAVLDQWHVDVLVLQASDQQHQVADLVRASSHWRVIYDTSGTLVAQRVSS